MERYPGLSEIVPEYRSRNPLVRWIFLRRLELALALARLDEPESLRILDLGCGEGLLMRRLREIHPRHSVTGVDHNPNVAAIELPGVKVVRGDLLRPESLPLGPFERIFCLDVLEHIEDLELPLRLVRGALSPDGLLVVSAPSENLFHKVCRFLIKGTFSEKEGPASSPHHHRADTLRRDIAAAGFELLEWSSLPLPGPLALIQVFAFKRKSP